MDNKNCPPELSPVIESSWSRCLDYGLAPERPLYPEIASRDLLSDRLEANARLVAFAQPVIENLYQQIAQSSSMVLLADAEGLILRTVGDPGFVDKAGEVALSPGANWSETAMGTNAIGTAAHEARTVAVYGGEHFLERNRFLTCIATPIHAPTGGMLGILDLSSDAHVSLPHARALLTATTELIEHRLLESLDCGHVLVQFSASPEILGSPLEGLALFDQGGAMIACNRRTRAVLGLAADGALPGFEACFDRDWRQLGRLVEASRAAPVVLRNRCRPELLGRLRWRGAAQARVVSTAAAGTGATAAHAFDRLDHGDARMQEAIRRARRVAGRAIPLLIQGETGTGKELFAQAFHQESPRRGAPFVAVNCAAIPASLIEAELFGHAPGAFTGARSKGARGKLQEADGGTVFLDEIGDMPLNLQAVLLRVLETRCVTPLGSAEEIPIDIALVCASHRPLQRLVSEGLFRADLLFRLNGLMVTLPALRERSDFDALMRSVLLEEAGGRGVALAPAALARLRRHVWPGNIRQLKNVLRVAVALLGDGESVLDERHLPEDLIEDGLDCERDAAASSRGDLRSTELRLIRECLKRHRGNVSAAARELGITRTTLYRKLRQEAVGV